MGRKVKFPGKNVRSIREHFEVKIDRTFDGGKKYFAK